MGVARTQHDLRVGYIILIGIAKQYKHLSRLAARHNARTRCSGAQLCSNTSVSRNSHKATKQNVSSSREHPHLLALKSGINTRECRHLADIFRSGTSSQLADVTRLVACFPLLAEGKRDIARRSVCRISNGSH